jgi:hypothetical protein
MKKKRFKGTFLYGFSIFLLYFVLFPPGTGKEQVVKPIKVYDLDAESEPGVNFKNSDKTTFFRVGDTFGFIDDDLNLLYKGEVDYDIAFSDTGFINYSSIQEGDQGFLFCNMRGEVKSSLRFPGYPTLNRNGKRIFIVKTDGTGLKEISQDGDELWKVAFPSLITSIATGDMYALLGLLNGSVKLYDPDGKCIYSVTLRDAKTETVYGCAISKNENAIAAVYGVHPQRIMIVKKGSESFDKPLSKELNTDFRKPVQIDFTEDGDLLFIEGNGSVIVCDTKSLDMWTVPIAGKLAAFTVSDDSAHVAVLARLPAGSKQNAGLYLVTPPNMLFAREYFNAASVSAELFGNRLLVGVDNELVVFEIGAV